MFAMWVCHVDVPEALAPAGLMVLFALGVITFLVAIYFEITQEAATYLIMMTIGALLAMSCTFIAAFWAALR